MGGTRTCACLWQVASLRSARQAHAKGKKTARAKRGQTRNRPLNRLGEIPLIPPALFFAARAVFFTLFAVHIFSLRLRFSPLITNISNNFQYCPWLLRFSCLLSVRKFFCKNPFTFAVFEANKWEGKNFLKKLTQKGVPFRRFRGL